jgi:hypothetical protein
VHGAYVLAFLTPGAANINQADIAQPISTKTKRFRVGISDCERAGPKACHGIHGASSDCTHPSAALVCSGESTAFDYPSCARRGASTVQLCMAVLRSVPRRAAGSRRKKEEKEVRCLPTSLISFFRSMILASCGHCRPVNRCMMVLPLTFICSQWQVSLLETCPPSC